MSLTRVYGRVKGTPCQPVTIAWLEAPMPTRTGSLLASARVSDCIASSAGERVKTQATAVPRRSQGLPAAAASSGANASEPVISLDHTSR